MNTDRMERFQEAREYQKKAIYALFPEQARGHLEVIENEIKAMIKEEMVNFVMSEKGQEFAAMIFAQMQSANYGAGDTQTRDKQAQDKQSQDKQNTNRQKKDSKVSKVTID